VCFGCVKLCCSDIAGETVISVDWSQITVSCEWFSVKLIGSLETDNINMHVLCFFEQPMLEQDLLHLTLPRYKLGSSFC
jgi:hypothetical protein